MKKNKMNKEKIKRKYKEISKKILKYTKENQEKKHTKVWKVALSHHEVFSRTGGSKERGITRAGWGQGRGTKSASLRG